MRKEYDFSKAKKNPYARRLKKQITLRTMTTTDADKAAYCGCMEQIKRRLRWATLDR